MAFNPEDHFSTKELLKARKYAWYILQLFPVAVFASINMAKNQRPCVETLNLSSENSSQTHNRTTRLKQGLKRFERIGMLLDEAIQLCFHPTLDSFFRENQIKFIQTELKSPDKLVRWTVREKNKTESSPTKYSVRFNDENQPARKRETDPYAHAYKEITENSSLKSDAKAKQIERPTNAYEVFKYLLDLSTIDYEATNETLSLRPNRALNWMVFEQLTGFLTIADYELSRLYTDYTLLPIRGSNYAYQLRNTEMKLSSFVASEFLTSPLEGYAATNKLLSEFIEKTSLSFSDIPLKKTIFDNPPDYINWISEMLILLKEDDRIIEQLLENDVEIVKIE